MIRAEWTSVADALRELRVGLEASAPTESDVHVDAYQIRKLIYLAQLDMLERVTSALSHTLKRRGSRFSEDRFRQIILGRLPRR